MVVWGGYYLAPGIMGVNSLADSDGLCSTLDGNRQDIIALLRDVPDRESVQIFFASSYPGAATSVQCGATGLGSSFTAPPF